MHNSTRSVEILDSNNRIYRRSRAERSIVLHHKENKNWFIAKLLILVELIKPGANDERFSASHEGLKVRKRVKTPINIQDKKNKKKKKSVTVFDCILLCLVCVQCRCDVFSFWLSFEKGTSDRNMCVERVFFSLSLCNWMFIIYFLLFVDSWSFHLWKNLFW